MSDLKLSITVLVLYITIILGIANIDAFQETVINFSPDFFLLVALIVFSELMITGNLIKLGVKITYYLVVVFWISIYILIWGFYWGNSRPLQVQIIQLLLVGLSAGLAYDVSKRVSQIDRTLNGLLSSAYPNRARDIHSARDLIDSEITRSRRYHYPLTVLVIHPDNRQGEGKDRRKQHESLEKEMLKRLATAKISRILSDLARDTDMVLYDKDGQFILLCPQTDLKYIDVLADRIDNAVNENLDARIYWGSASFPDEAITFDELIQTAKIRLDRSKKYHLHNYEIE